MAVVGLGQVGFPLASKLGERYPTVGYDSSATRLRWCAEVTRSVTDLQVIWTAEPKQLAQADIFFLALPTSLDANQSPDLSALEAGCEMVGAHMKRGSTVVIESTVYPGATEGVCIPTLESVSGYKWQRDFTVAYSPERVSPGDAEHSLYNTPKLVAADSPSTLARIAAIYSSIIKATVYEVSSIRVAEAAKLIENAQRDASIAVTNEFSTILRGLGLDTNEVLEAASTKWNFVRFSPGLVGGPCLRLATHYLHRSTDILTRNSSVLLAGRATNENLARQIAEEIILRSHQQQYSAIDVIVLGISFKEDWPELENSGAVRLAQELQRMGCRVYVHDPIVDDIAANLGGLRMHQWDDLPDGVPVCVLAVPHKEYRTTPIPQLLAPLKPGGTCFDLRGVLAPDLVRECGYELWRL